MSTQIEPPQRRQCERCGRTERWDDSTLCWQVDDGQVGRSHCIHEWDITGSYDPLSE